MAGERVGHENYGCLQRELLSRWPMESRPGRREVRTQRDKE